MKISGYDPGYVPDTDLMSCGNQFDPTTWTFDSVDDANRVIVDLSEAMNCVAYDKERAK